MPTTKWFPSYSPKPSLTKDTWQHVQDPNSPTLAYWVKVIRYFCKQDGLVLIVSWFEYDLHKKLGEVYWNAGNEVRKSHFFMINESSLPHQSIPLYGSTFYLSVCEAVTKEGKV